MFITFGDIERDNTIRNTVGGVYEYKYYKNMFGDDYVDELGEKKLSRVDKTKSKEYNNINTSMNRIVREIDVYKKELERYIKDLNRKLKDIDRSSSPNSIEAYNETYKNLSGFMTQRLNAIVQKGTFTAKTFDLLQKQQKQDMDLGKAGMVNGKDSMPLHKTPSANFLSVLKSDTSNLPNLRDISLGDDRTDTDALKGEHDVEPIIMNSVEDRYKMHSVKYGSALDIKYAINPKTGYGYLRYTTPDGVEGIKPMTIRQFDIASPNYSTMTISDKSNTTYEMEEVDHIPKDIEQEWNKYFDGINELARKK